MRWQMLHNLFQRLQVLFRCVVTVETSRSHCQGYICSVGNSESDLTELEVVLRRKQHLQSLCTVYQVESPPYSAQTCALSWLNNSCSCSAQTQLRGVLNSTKHTRDGKTKDVAAEVVLSSNLQPLPNLQTALPVISRSEQVSAAAVNRELDAKRALAVLCGKHTRYVVYSTAVDLGRSTGTQGKVRQRRSGQCRFLNSLQLLCQCHQGVPG